MQERQREEIVCLLRPKSTDCRTVVVLECLWQPPGRVQPVCSQTHAPKCLGRVCKLECRSGLARCLNLKSVSLVRKHAVEAISAGLYPPCKRYGLPELRWLKVLQLAVMTGKVGGSGKGVAVTFNKLTYTVPVKKAPIVEFMA